MTPRPPSAVVGVGASAGGVEALSRFVEHLPADFPGAVVVVLHVAPHGTSVLDQILDRRCRVPVLTAADRMPVEAGHVYVAPPDRHVVVEDDHLCLSLGPRENGHRPAVDPLLRSIADRYGPRAAGVILSGTRDDGTAGLAYLKAAGGTAFVQDPEEALYPGMPANAIQHVAVDVVLGVAPLAHAVVDFTTREQEMVSDDPQDPSGSNGDPTRYTCPECGGMLMRREDAGVARFACSVGHVYSPESLDEEQESVLEGALWAGARMLEDRAVFLKEMADRAASLGHTRSAAQFESRSAEAQQRSDALRAMIERPAGEEVA